MNLGLSAASLQLPLLFVSLTFTLNVKGYLDPSDYFCIPLRCRIYSELT